MLNTILGNRWKPFDNQRLWLYFSIRLLCLFVLNTGVHHYMQANTVIVLQVHASLFCFTMMTLLYYLMPI